MPCQPDHSHLIRRGLVPYIVKWSAEDPVSTKVIAHPRRGIGYPDEIIGDRDEHGVLWDRYPSRPGQGRPEFGSVHSLRQRRTMRRLLCQVCGRPADRTDDGVLWILKDHRDDWPDWPRRMAVTEPPICRPCALTSVGNCPALRRGSVAVRVRRSTVAGVLGVRYRPGTMFPVPESADDIVAFEDPAIRWIRANQLVRELLDCTIVEVDGGVAS